MTDLLQIIENLVNDIPALTILFSAVCYLIGFVMTIQAITKAQKRQEMGANSGSWNSPITTFIIASMFLGLPGLISILNVTLFAADVQSPSSIFAYADSTIGMLEEEAARTMITGLVTIVQFLGLIAVARGLFLLNQSAQGPGGGPKTFGPGLTFIISGICATNFPIFVGIMESLIT